MYRHILTVALCIVYSVAGAEMTLISAPSQLAQFTAGICRPIPNVEGMQIEGEHALNPVAAAVNALWEFEVQYTRLPEEQRRAALTTLEKTATATILQVPTHGRLTSTTKESPQPSPYRYFYNPKPRYMGKDQAIFLVEMSGYRIKIIYNLYPIDGATGDYWDKKICGKRGTIYKIEGK